MTANMRPMSACRDCVMRIATTSSQKAARDQPRVHPTQSGLTYATTAANAMVVPRKFLCMPNGQVT